LRGECARDAKPYATGRTGDDSGLSFKHGHGGGFRVDCGVLATAAWDSVLNRPTAETQRI
jgi:hypothetical protein